eukprot:comp22285_c2_seq1/m.53234 comp22285_c2_seq1/g.53234  ORF comp22285_c2_seq1/g.53234 comp22285_c2_seq1/m.53234 type:complete len:353 (+) comp22285_c2_seq1:2477-3535(+)
MEGLHGVCKLGGVLRRCIDIDGLLGHHKACANERLEEGMLGIAAKAGHFTGGGHLDTKHGVGALHALPRELRRLACNVVDLGEGDLGRRHTGETGKHTGCKIDKVDIVDLGHERERARGADIALNDLDVVLAVPQELHVHRARDVEALGDLGANILELGMGHRVDARGREKHGGIARVDTGVLNMLRERADNNLAVLRHGIKVKLAVAVVELGDHNRVVRADAGGLLEKMVEVLLTADHAHRGTREHIGRAHKHRVADLVGKLLGLLNCGKLGPGRLVDLERVEKLRELLAVFGAVNVRRLGAEQRHAGAVERDSKIVRDLATHGHNHAIRVLLVRDVEHALKTDLLKVESV